MNKLTEKRGAIKFDRADILYLAAITVIGLAIRLILRVVKIGRASCRERV